MSYKSQAAKEIDAQIKGAKAVNAGARDRITERYARYLDTLDTNQQQDRGALANTQEAERARMANRLAARGGAGDGAVQFNYGRLNAQHEGDVTNLLSKYAQQRGELLGKEGDEIGNIDAQEEAMLLKREASIRELARQLEDRGIQHQQARLAAAAYHDQKEAAKKQEEATFRENLRIIANGLDDGTPAAGLPELAAYARQFNRNLADYYTVDPKTGRVTTMFGRNDLVSAAAKRRGLLGGMTTQQPINAQTVFGVPASKTSYMDDQLISALQASAAKRKTAVDEYIASRNSDPNNFKYEAMTSNDLSWWDKMLRAREDFWNSIYGAPIKTYY